jgi:hypothetical protein
MIRRLIVGSDRKLAIEKNVKKLIEINEKYKELDDQRNRLGIEHSRVRSKLFEDRPKEYVQEVLDYLESKKDESGVYRDMIIEVENWLEGYDKFMKERLKYVGPVQRAMIKGEIE